MKALSVKQPWSFLIGGEEKTIELRSWQTDYRGDLLICAAKSEKDAWAIVDGVEHQLPAGVMMCVAELVDVRKIDNTHENCDAAFVDEIEPGVFGWFLENVRHVRLVPINGKLRLFDGDSRFSDMFSDNAEISETKDGLREIKEHRAATNEKFKETNNQDFYFVVACKDRAEKEAALKALHIPKYENFVSGDALLAALKVVSD